MTDLERHKQRRSLIEICQMMGVPVLDSAGIPRDPLDILLDLEPLNTPEINDSMEIWLLISFRVLSKLCETYVEELIEIERSEKYKEKILELAIKNSIGRINIRDSFADLWEIQKRQNDLRSLN